MSGGSNDNRDSQHSVRRAYRDAIRWMTFAWAVSLGFVVAVQFGWPAIFRWAPVDAVLIAVGSLVVSFVSLTPGLGVRQLSGGFCQAMLAGIGIRLLGTVALFLTCRYQLASSAQVIAGMTIGWYVLLTSVEVYALSRCQFDSVPAGTVESGPVDTH